MKRTNVSRRSFLKKSALLLSTYPLANNIVEEAYVEKPVPSEGVRLNWLIKPDSDAFAGTTCGVCWPKGQLKKQQAFQAFDSHDKPVPIQTWPLAFWPDGSLKWSAHAFNGNIAETEHLFIKPVKTVKQEKGIAVTETTNQILIETGKISCIIEKSGDQIIKSVSRAGKEIVKNGRLVLLCQDKPDGEDNLVVKKEKLQGQIQAIKLEQQGPVRAVVRISGIHKSVSTDNQLIHFTVRLYFYHNSEAIRIMHTMVFDGDENQHFIKGMGLAFDVNLEDEMYNRHVRFVNSENDGIFSEAVKGLTGLRRQPDISIRKKQLSGEAIAEEDFPEGMRSLLKYIPSFGDYTLCQSSARSFSIHKRTGESHGWLAAAEGSRAAGLVYLGIPSGGLAAGIRNFWQSFPGQLDVRNAAEDTATINLWLWAPDTPAMDLRFYHDGMGQNSYTTQLEGLEITYEDYEPGFGTPKGVARTSELMLWVTDKTPSGKTLLGMASALQQPATLVCDIQHLEKQKVFGGNWSMTDRSTPEKTKIENELDGFFDYYKKQIDQHNWYGFWNYGDFMHTYDADRHTWRYDVGGFAWDNSELSTDLWLWYYFLHTGRSDAFQIAEAMTRHTGEVDVHHLGPFAPLGSRHNVQHWGCSAKQLRISTAANRRIYYYLTADERVGDLLDEQVNGIEKLAEIVPIRKLPGNAAAKKPDVPNTVHASFGTDWGAIAAAWLTKWERTGDAAIKQKLLNSMATIAAQPKGFFTQSAWMDTTTGKFLISKDDVPSVSHLNAVFGLTEVCEELVALVDMPEFTKAWLQYCRLYNASEEEQLKELGKSFPKLNLQQGHSRLTAYAASQLNDASLAKRAWTEFYSGRSGIVPEKTKVTTISGPLVLAPVDENAFVSTNAVAQWGLAAIQCLAFIGKHI